MAPPKFAASQFAGKNLSPEIPTLANSSSEKGQWIPCGDYNHYLHHKLFECNYAGGGMSFFDKIFGTFHDGSEESDLAFREKRKSRRYL